MSSKIHAGLELLSALGAIELKPIEIRDLLYNLIPKDYNIIDEILEVAQREKLLQKTEKTYVLTPGASGLQFEKPRIVKQEERGACKALWEKHIHRVLPGIQVTYLWALWVVVHSEDIFGLFVVNIILTFLLFNN